MKERRKLQEQMKELLKKESRRVRSAAIHKANSSEGAKESSRGKDISSFLTVQKTECPKESESK